jgi:hypothetical protein
MKRILILALVALGIAGIVLVARRNGEEIPENWTPVQPS